MTPRRSIQYAAVRIAAAIDLGVPDVDGFGLAELGGGRLLIDLGPLLVFFLVNFLAPVPQVMKIFVATGAFMAAMVAARACARAMSASRSGRTSF